MAQAQPLCGTATASLCFSVRCCVSLCLSMAQPEPLYGPARAFLWHSQGPSVLPCASLWPSQSLSVAQPKPLCGTATASLCFESMHAGENTCNSHSETKEFVRCSASAAVELACMKSWFGRLSRQCKDLVGLVTLSRDVYRYNKLRVHSGTATRLYMTPPDERLTG